VKCQRKDNCKLRYLFVLLNLRYPIAVLLFFKTYPQQLSRKLKKFNAYVC